MGEERGSGGRRLERLWGVLAALTALLVTGYFLLPIDAFGADRPVASWTLFLAILVSIAAVLLKQMWDVLMDRTGVHPGFLIPLMVCLTVLVFSAAYFNLAEEPGQFVALHTRLDALYFTVATLATVGYGDIHPSSQTARMLVLVQIVYNLVFLTAAVTALSRRFRSHLTRRRPPEVR